MSSTMAHRLSGAANLQLRGGSSGVGALELEFQDCKIATLDGSEEGRICLADGIVFAVLARLGSDSADDQGWYLLTGFGRCEQEGIIFQTLDEAGNWIRDRIVENRREGA
jgi:hypothetical protein